MDKKQFPLERMRTTAQEIADDADLLGQELRSRMQQMDQTELQLPPAQRSTIASFLGAIDQDISDFIAAEESLAAGVRAAADQAETVDTGDAHGFTFT